MISRTVHKNLSAAWREQEEVLTAASDHTLMEAVARGQTLAFEQLSFRHLRTMLGVAHRILGNAAEAEEVVQEGFLRLWRQAPQWDPDGTGSVKTWLSRVITNLCLDRCRRRRDVPLEEAGEVQDTARDAFDDLGLQDRQKLVQSLLSGLPERQRVAVVLAYFEEMSGKEIAEAMELSAGAVESLLVRARRTLRDRAETMGIVWGENI
ncbi:MAG: sigma-70 family RNA polymerase sigma factor [Alphaproteobacteria bacterium]|nr:sigma-70 family RNA polymerase sigma factor [Alphaproteobacteria bacterium]